MLSADHLAEFRGLRFELRTFRSYSDGFGDLAHVQGDIHFSPGLHVNLDRTDHLFAKALLFDGYVVPPNAERIGRILTRDIGRRLESGATIGVGDRHLGTLHDCAGSIPHRAKDASHVFLGEGCSDHEGPTTDGCNTQISKMAPT